MILRRLSGKCFCGAVEYEVADEFEYSAYCHCSNCRRTTGSAFKPFAGIRRAKFKLTPTSWSTAKRTATTATANSVALWCSLSFATEPTFTSLWGRWSMIRPFGRRSTFSSAPRRRGSRLPMIFRDSRGTHRVSCLSDDRPRESARRRLASLPSRYSRTETLTGVEYRH
jgi:Glutathione-dependent formaldehyde-activating enzyme